jgi:hypothetical protein
MLTTIDNNGRMHTKVTGPRLVTPSRKVPVWVAIGDAEPVVVKVKLQHNKITWRELAKRVFAR